MRSLFWQRERKRRREEEEGSSPGVTQCRGVANREEGLRVKGPGGKFNVPLQWVTRGCNCRGGRNGASIAPMGVVR